MQAGLSTKNAPSPNVVLPHYAAGAIFFILASVLLFIAANDITLTYIGPKILAITHILVLGWITLIIFGALYQLIPVIMEVKLFSEPLAHISLYSMISGILLLSYSFWNSYIATTMYMQIGGTFIFISVILFVINALFSALKTKQKTIENAFIVTAAVWLLITVLLGIFITLNFTFQIIDKSNLELLRIHVQFGIIGWFMMLVIGVASKLLPMFFIAHKLNRIFLKLSYYFVNFGLITIIIALYFTNDVLFLALAGLILVIGLMLFIKYNYDAYKMRLRKKLDIGMKLSVFAFLLLALTLILGFLAVANFDSLSSYANNIKLGYGISLILGFFTSLILGQMYKTLPFIVWLKIYQDKVGKFEIPMPADLYSEKVANLHYYTFILAIVNVFIGIFIKESLVVQISAGAFFVTAVLFAFNTFKIIFHKDISKPLK